MPIHLYTGQPGNGKTALMVEELLDNATDKNFNRPLAAGGIDGLEPGIATIIANPAQWNAVRPGEVCTCHVHQDSPPCEAHVIPNGAKIFIDEAWKWFGHLQDASRQAMPGHVLDLAEHRHRGIDMVWTTQMPSQLFPFARALIGSHTHVLRRFGTKFLDTYTWGELVEDVKSTTKRDAGLKKTRTLPEKAFNKYRSAFVHTIKPKLPLRILALPVIFVVGGVLLYFAYQSMKPDAIVDATQGTEGPQAAQADAAPSSPKSGKPAPASYNSAEEYARYVLARVPAAPWTAPAYDGRSAASQPQVFCAESGAGLDANGVYIEKATITCLTEQGTRYLMPDRDARNLARNGMPYNPFKAPVTPIQTASGVQGDSPAVDAAPAAAPAVGAGERGFDGQQAGYGAMRPET